MSNDVRPGILDPDNYPEDRPYSSDVIQKKKLCELLIKKLNTIHDELVVLEQASKAKDSKGVFFFDYVSGAIWNAHAEVSGAIDQVKHEID